MQENLARQEGLCIYHYTFLTHFFQLTLRTMLYTDTYNYEQTQPTSIETIRKPKPVSNQLPYK